MSLRPAYEDALAGVERQLGTVGALEQKASQLLRVAGVLLTFLVGLAALVVSRQPPAGLPSVAALLTGIPSVGISVALSSSLFLRAPVVSVLSPMSYRMLAAAHPDPEAFYERAIRAYATALESNASHLQRAAVVLRWSWVALVVGVALSAVGSMGLIVGVMTLWP